MLNVPGLFAFFHSVINPKLLIPSLVVSDISQVDFSALRHAGYRGAVFDKDNTITYPYRDAIVPELKDAWIECRKVFGPGNVLIVSNSAGTASDPAGIAAESVSHHTGVSVLRQTSLKPSYRCIQGIVDYFASLPQPVRPHELVVVGDRVFTDVVLANRMRQQNLNKQKEYIQVQPEKVSEGVTDALDGPLSILTTRLWKQDSRFFRLMEGVLMKQVRKYDAEGEQRRAFFSERFIKPSKPTPPLPPSRIEKVKTSFSKLLRFIGSK